MHLKFGEDNSFGRLQPGRFEQILTAVMERNNGKEQDPGSTYRKCDMPIQGFKTICCLN